MGIIDRYYWKGGRSTFGIVSKLVNCWYSRKILKMGSYIGNPRCFESRPVFPHGIAGIFISGGAHIGRNCVIFQQVTIGSNGLPDSKGYGFPSIGDNVLIGAGAKIIGNVTIGSHCRIGANAVVTTDIPDNCVVVMGPPRVIQKSNLKNAFYTTGADGMMYIDEGDGPQHISLDC